MRKAYLFITIFALAICAFGCAGNRASQSDTPADQSLFGIDDSQTHPVVIITTSMGPIVVRLDAEKAPITVENFLKYVKSGFYTNTVFHRVIPGFMIQGGGFEAGTLRKKGTEFGIKNESGNGLENVRGSIAMARTSDLDSATSQFYINLVDNTNLDSMQYAVFGEVIIGLDTIDAIANVQTGSRALPNGTMDDVPVQDVIIQSITLNR